jgi:hypothetical protein
MLTSNTTLTKLSLTGNPLSAAELRTVGQALKTRQHKL